VAAERGGPRWAAGGAVAVALVLVVLWIPGNSRLWARLHGTTPDRIILGEDGSGVSVVKMPREPDGETVVFVNGVGQSVIPYGGIHTILGALPAFVHPDPRSVAIIGLGSGDTVHAVAGRPVIERITSIEIVGSQLETLQRLATRIPYGGLRGLLSDPRIEHVVGDGRTYLMRTNRRFDIIEADALRPTSAYSGNLYSDAYFRLVRDRLTPRGIAATWTASGRIHDAFVQVFPHVVSVPGVMLGSNEPIPWDPAAIAARVADPRVRSYYQRAGLDIERLIGEYLDGEHAVYRPDFDRSRLTDVNTDLFPRDEYDLSPPRP
jgi:spermidine synthase